MSDEIKSYNLGADEGITDHDAVCIAQAGKLLQIGYLEYETAAYGTAYYQDNVLYYYISAKEDTMDKFLHQCYCKNIYPTPVKYFFKRYDLVNDTEDAIKYRFRLEIARQLQTAYPMIFFEAVTDLTKASSDNSAFPILKEITAQLDSCFDLNQLKLFGNLLEMLLRGRLLNQEGYLLMNQWLSNEYEKISVEPVVSGDYRRTYSGFAYEKPDSKITYFCDAFPYMASEKQMMFINKSYLVTPILTTTYYADSFQHLENSRVSFKADLETYLGDIYLKLMVFLRSLPSSVNHEQYVTYQEKIKETGSKQAIDAFRYYGVLWNVNLATK